jgi:hypothetical protein
MCLSAPLAPAAMSFAKSLLPSTVAIHPPTSPLPPTEPQVRMNRQLWDAIIAEHSLPVLKPSSTGPILGICHREFPMTPTDRRFARQFEALSRLIPRLRGTIAFLRAKKWLVIRLPLALILIAGGMFSFLPILGIWMLPLGLLLLAVDLPPLRGPISNLTIRARRKINLWIRRWRARKRP